MAGVYSVAQVNSYIKNMFAQDFLLRRLSVKGEVSNCKYHSSGHIYFTLKDGGGTLQAVMFASQRRGLNFKLAEGQQVVVKGTVDVYERDGKYQLYASEIELSGRGDLYLRFEKLLKELEEMGLAAPQITYIMHALKEHGLNVDADATTVEEARDSILAALKASDSPLLKEGGAEK